MIRCAWRWLLAVVYLWPAAAGAGAQSSAAEVVEARLQPGDAVRIAVWRRPELSGEFTIGGDSSIQHPLYKDVKVAGVPLTEARARLQQYLTRLETDPQFVLVPLIRVAVGGEVRQPNLYSLAPETTIAQAIALAGGPTERGRLDRVKVLRDSVELELDLTSTSSADVQTPVRSGDRVFIVSRRSIFRDYVLPVIGLAGSIASIVNVLQ